MSDPIESPTPPCDCYPHGCTPDTFEGPQRWCPLHGELAEEPECPDIWHVLGDVTADECPTCGYRLGGEDGDAPWPADVIAPLSGDVRSVEAHDGR